ncbi:hypothetical protein FACS1894181_07800 [Bacteroidia bacterium]|nr:hypothetical protein FACS1894181_07800 [Bacteroidia bacterium]
MKEKLKTIFRKVSPYLFNWRGTHKINLIKTIYYNFRIFPFHIAKKLPIYIHSGVKVYKMGKIRIEGKVTRRMITIGGYNLKAQGVSKILNKGEIIFKGPVRLGGEAIIENNGIIIFEGETIIGESCTFLIQRQLVIGKYTRIGFRCLWTDSDYHYMINVQTGEIKRNEKEIVIGKCNWIANTVTIKKGTRTPDYTIAAANSLLLKDYTTILPPYSIIGGMPAKLITSGYRRIYNRKEEEWLSQYFNEHDVPSFNLDLDNIDINEYCTKDPL